MANLYMIASIDENERTGTMRNSRDGRGMGIKTQLELFYRKVRHMSTSLVANGAISVPILGSV